MDCKNLLSWKVVVELSEESKSQVDSKGLFNLKTGNSFLKGIGGFAEHTFSPEVLDPTNVFHNALNKVKLAHGFKGRRFPYTHEDGQKLNINIRRFGGRICIVTVQLKKHFLSDEGKIFELQKISRHLDIYIIVKSICGLILSGDPKKFSAIHSPKIYPCTQAVIVGDNWISDDKAVEILTRHKEPNENIVSKVIAKNANHQLDSSHILIDRQGIFYRVPECMVNSGSVNKKYLGACNIIEYAVALALILEKNYFDNLSSPEQAFIERLVLKPELVILHSITSLETWRLLVIEFRLDALLSQAISAPNSEVKEEPWSRYFTDMSTESKRFWAIGLIIAALWWAFQQSIYFDKLASFFSIPEIEIITPVDEEVIEMLNERITVTWEQVDGAAKYVIQLQMLESGKWMLPAVDHRLVTAAPRAELRVSPYFSYKFLIEAYDRHGDRIAKSNDSFFEVSLQDGNANK